MRIPDPKLLAAAAAVTTVLVACQGSGQTSPVLPTSPATQSRTTYDEEELALFRQAVRRVAEFEARNQPILAAGKLTRHAKQLYRSTLREWQASYAQLQSHERDGIRVARAPVVLSTEATSIKSFQDDAAEVTLVRCTEQSELGVSQAGVLLPAVHEEPVLQKVVVHRYENRTWRIGEFTTTSRPCSG